MLLDPVIDNLVAEFGGLYEVLLGKHFVCGESGVFPSESRGTSNGETHTDGRHVLVQETGL